MNKIATLRLTVSLAFIAWCSSVSLAQLTLVKDINQQMYSANPYYFTDANGVAYFSAADAVHGTELWKLDEQNNPVFIKDLNQGTSSSSPSNFINVNGVVFFTAETGQGRELWKTDGTPGGTVMLYDINPGSPWSNIAELTNVNGVLYFRASSSSQSFTYCCGFFGSCSQMCNGTNVLDSELWKSDGTFSGTVRVKDIYPGTSSSTPQNLINLNGSLYFSAYDGTDYALWKSDGSSAGTVKIKSLSGGFGSGVISIGNAIYFTASDGVTGIELWTSDGTAAGTTLVKDIFVGASGSGPQYFTNVNGVLFFVANDGVSGAELWKSDGTDAGTMQVKDIVAGSGSPSLQQLTSINNTLYFLANDGVSGTELWKSDGTGSGTLLVKDIYPGTTQGAYSFCKGPNGSIILSANDGVNGQELWTSDGTAGGTVIVKDIFQGASGSSPYTLTFIQNNSGGRVLFIAYDGINGSQLWTTDGTAQGTIVIPLGISGNGAVANLIKIGNTIFFTANDGNNGVELWQSDGSAGGTTIVKDIYPGYNGSNPTNLTNVNGVLYFTANDASGSGLWKSDGTSAGTVLLKNLSPQYLTEVNGILFFTAYDATNGYELWKSDGTPAGTVLVKDIYSGSASSSPYNFISANGTLYFVANDGASGYELWKSDGTDAGTVLVGDIYPGVNGSGVNSLTATDNTLFFVASNGSAYGLWKVDFSTGTATNIPIVGLSGSPSNLVRVGNLIYFNASTSASGSELWRSDGTNAGTFQVKDIIPGTGSSYPQRLMNVNGLLLFTASDAQGSNDLWRSDGTSSGTTKAYQASWGLVAYTINIVANENGTAYFTASDSQGNLQLWSTDGNPCGTRPITTGSQFNINGTAVILNGAPYLSYSSIGGTELFKVIISPPPVCVANAITFPPIDQKTYGDAAFALSGTATDGLPVTYTISDPSIAQINGSTVTILAAGTATITAQQYGDPSHSAAVDVPQILTINKANQTITFNPLPPRKYGDAPFPLNASVNSKLQISYSSSNTSVATVTGNTVTIVGVGSTTITASQLSGSSNYNAAVDVPQQLTVNKAMQTISFSPGSIDPSFNPTDIGFGAGDGANGLVNTVVRQPDGKVLIGGSFISYGAIQSRGIARLNADGSFDTNFLQGGGINGGSVKAIAVLPDNKIMVGGSFTSYNGIACKSLVRLNSDGSLDPNFVSPIGAFGNVINVNSIVLQSDGKILVGGNISGGQSSVILQRLNPDGTTDSSFSSANAMSVYNNPTVNSIVIQSDGKVLAGGQFQGTSVSYYVCGPNGQMCPMYSQYYNYVKRLNADGSVDANFLTPSNTNSFVIVNSIALQADGKIVFGGNFNNYNGIGRNNLARLNSDGSLDGSFYPGFGANGPVNASSIQSNGKILFAGSFNSYNGSVRNGVVRVNTDGSIDTGFDSGSATSSNINSVVLQPNGSILIGGGFSKGVARLTSSGSLDPNFNKATGGNAQIWPISLQPDGKVVVGGGFTTYNGTARNRIARLNSDGSLDAGFDPGSGVNGNVFANALQPDSKILVGGNFTTYNGVARQGIARLNSDGSLDAGFDPGSGTSANSILYSFALQADGKVLIGGNFSTYNGTTRQGLARLNSDGSLDPGFDSGPGTDPNTSTVTAVALQPDGKILIGGTFTTYDGVARQGVARLNSDGSLDTGFDPGSGTSSGSTVYSITLQSDGRILIGGNFTTYNSIARHDIARLNSDGSLDTSFDSGSGTNSNSIVYSTAIQPDGKILIGGNFTTYIGINRNGLARLNSDGSLDAIFDPGSGASPPGLTTSSVVLLQDGKVLIGGSFTSYNGTGRNRIARVNGSLPTKTYGDAPFTLSAQSSSGLPVTFSSSNPAVATVSGNTLTIVGAGTTTITADQPGNPFYLGAISAQQTLTVNKANQAITFNTLTVKNFGDVPFTLAATSNSGLAISYVSSNTSVATVSGNTVTIVGVGTTTITASQTGNSNYNAAGDVPQALTVNKGDQTITFSSVTTKNYGDAPFTLGATSSAGLAVSYASSNTSVATVSGNTLTIVGAGTTTITASQAGSGNYNAATDVPQTLTVNKANQTITFNTLTSKNYGDAPFTLAATSSSGLTVSYASSNTSVATVSGNTVTIVGAGTTTITASQSGNGNYNAATDVPQTLTVNKANQTITFNTLTSKNYGDAPFTLAATSSSGLTVSYASSSTSVATVSGNTVTIVGAGTTTITASQTGNGNYNPATDVSQSLTVNKASQTITFNTLASKNYGDAPFTLGATSNAGLAISYASSNTSVATVSGNTVTIVGAGTTTITASQAGNSNYTAATDMPQSLTVNKANQTITFNTLASKNYGDAPFTLGATASSTLTVSYSSSNTSVATVSGNTVTIIGTGTTTITASQSGNGNYNPATSVPQTLAVSNVGQAITFSPLPSKNYGDAPFTLGATASSGLAVSYTSSNATVATISGSTLTIVGAGTTTITASQPGDNNYGAATNVPQTFTVNKASQTITFNSLTIKNFGDAPFTLGATANSGLMVSYSSSNTSVATVSGSIVTIVGTGTTTITASQIGNSNYNAATDVPQTLTVNKANQAITFNALTSKNFGDAPFTLGATASSGLTVSYSSSNTSVATISGSIVTIVGTGTTTITASQIGNSNYNAATDVPQTLTVNKANQAITFNAFTSKNFGDAPFTLGATASSGLTVSYSSSNTSVATVSGGAVTIVGAGTATLIASQVGDTNYNAATDASQQLTVNKAVLTATADNQSIIYGGAIPTFTVSYSGFVGSDNGSVISSAPIASSTAQQGSAAGSYTISLSGGATNDNYSLALASGILTIGKASQQIVFNSIPQKAANDAPFTLNATSSSGLSVAYIVDDVNVATISGNTVTIVGAGVANITATQVGDNNFNAAQSVSQVLTVASKQNQAITFAPLSNVAYGTSSVTLNATSSSGLSVTYSSSDPSVATISGNVVTIVGAGMTTITASQSGDASYFAATDVSQTLTINKGDQTITFNSLPAVTYGGAAFDLAATSSSGHPVSYSSSNTSVATVTGKTVTIVGAGTTTITATLGGDNNYKPATDVQQTLTVNKASQTITVVGISLKTLGDAPFSLSATASSGLAVTYATTSDKISISGSTVTLVKAGRAIVTASQSGNASYNSASVDQSFCINPPKPTITLSGKNTAAVTLTSSNSSGNQWFLNDAAIPNATNATLAVTQPGIYKVKTTADDCSSAFSDNSTLVVTGEISNPFESIMLYPNPVQNYLEVTGINEINESVISDAMGRTFTIELRKEGEVYRGDVHSLANGMYILQIRQGSNWHQFKLIKN